MPHLPRCRLHEAPLFPHLQARLLEDLEAACRADPLTPRVVVVPHARLGLHLEQALSRSARGPLQLRCLTWVELAALAGARPRWQQDRRCLTPLGMAVLARRALARDRRPPGFFSNALDQRGFRSAMLRCFDTLAAAGLVRAADVERFVVRQGAELGMRVRHVLELAITTRRLFEARLDDDAALVERAAAAPDLGAAVPGGRLWVYGFDTLSALERRFLSALASAAEIAIDLYLPEPASTGTGTGAWARTVGFAPAEMEVVAADTDVTAEVLSAPGEEAEAREVARRILHAADTGIPFARMAVVSRTPTTLALVADTLESVGVAFAAPTLFALGSRRAGRAMLQFLDLADGDFAARPVLDFLLLVPARWHEWCGIVADPVPSAWERVARQARLGSGLPQWRESLVRQRQVLLQRRRGDATAPSHADRTAAAACDELLQVAETLAADLRQLPERARWSEFVAIASAWVARVCVDTAETRALLAALQRLHALEDLPAARPTRADFRDAVRYALAETRVPPEASHPDGVVLGTADELYGCDFDLVCVVGLQEGEWPGPVTEDPVLPDRERLALNRACGVVGALPLRADVLERQRRLFRVTAAAARQRLVLSYARLDPATGAARLPAALLLEWAEERAGRRLDYEAFAQLPWCERVPLRRREPPPGAPLLSLAECDDIAVAQLHPRTARRYVRGLGVQPARGLALALLRNGRRRFTAYDGFLGDAGTGESLAAFIGRPLSASQLEVYATCPFKFFLRHLLRLEVLERDERREPSALEVGLLVHRILESFYHGLEQDGVTFEAESFEALRQRLLAAADASFAAFEATGAHGARLLWEIRRQQLRDDLVRFLRHERQWAASDPGWVPWRYEFPFGPGHTVCPGVRRGAQVLRLRGKIDRVDVHTHHGGLRVVDYKSGRMRSGRRAPGAVQLVLYLLALADRDDERLGRSEARFVHVTRRGGFEIQRLAGTRVQARRDDFEALVRDIASGIEAGEFFPEPGEGGVHCKACDFRGVCDARIQRQVERKTAGGQDARWRELPDFGAELETLGRPASAEASDD